MMNDGLVEALNGSIDRLNAGGNVRDCLRAHPRYATELEPLLRLGLAVRELVNENDRAAEAAIERQRFRVERAAAMMTAGRTRRRTWIMPGAAARWIASLALIVVLLAGGTALLAESSLPGDALYGLKLWTESARLTLLPNDLALADGFAARRIDEAEALVRLRRQATVTLTGTVEAILTDGLVIEGLTVQANTEGIRPGSRVEAEVRSTGQGTLIALRLRPIDPPQGRPASEPSPIATAGQRATPTSVPPTAPARGSDEGSGGAATPPASARVRRPAPPPSPPRPSRARDHHRKHRPRPTLMDVRVTAVGRGAAGVERSQIDPSGREPEGSIDAYWEVDETANYPQPPLAGPRLSVSTTRFSKSNRKRSAWGEAAGCEAP
ncbi:MAG: hypothetical protein IPK19_18000 [Chloroflexi bacterium]|nr:hypothetical protein [Chloroflexota bacterium]